MMDMSSSSDYILDHGESRSKSSKKRLYIIGIVIGVIAFTIGILIGYFGKPSPAPTSCPEGPCLGSGVPDKIIQDGDPEITQKIIDKIKAANIKENLRQYTSYPHLGGTEGENRLAKEVHESFEASGLDNVRTISYDVLLSYPNKSDPSIIQLLDGDGKPLFTSQEEEKILRPEQNHTDVIPPFNAYSVPGDQEGDLIYVNYARIEDFKKLEELNVSVAGKILIARYGKIFRGDKLSFAEELGALGLILYTDPADYTVDTTEDPYPDSWWLPDTGVQRGTVFLDNGDPLTPGYPSIGSAYRSNISDTNLPKIMCHPISYGDAYQLLRHMGGDEVPPGWSGGLNITYRLGPFQNDTWKVKMHVTTHNEMRSTSNVIGFITGVVEPDRYVILGNHRDAWVFGAVDPTSGTASMVEVARVLGEIVKEGWRPRRTIMFASWGAEEYALIGSYEWVENFQKILSERAVANLNVDLTIKGNDSMVGSGVPLLHDAMYDVAKKIKTPNNPDKTLYDEWSEVFPKTDENGTNLNVPSISSLGAGSDYAAFLNFAGISSIDVRYSYDKKKWPILDYPLYHSVYETFHLVENFIDPKLEYSAAIATYWAEMTRLLADSLILPMNVETYASELLTYINGLDKGYGDLMRKNGVPLDDLYIAAANFSKYSKDFNGRLQSINKKNPIEVRQYNDQMLKLERAFTDFEGIPMRPLYKHLLFAPSQHDGYAGATFPGLIDLMYEIEEAPDKEKQWEDVKKHLATIIYTVAAAGNTLAKPTSFLDY